MDSQSKPTPIHYETTWQREPRRPKLPRGTSSIPSGSIVRLVLGTITTVSAVYAVGYTMILMVIGSIGAAFGGGDVFGAELLVVTALMLTGGILMMATRWSRSGGIVSGAILMVGAVLGIIISAEDSSGLSGILAIMSCVAGVFSIFVSILWGGTGSRI